MSETFVSGLVDLHVHSGPSIMPRRTTDPETRRIVIGAGVERFVLKAHEGSTAERAALLGGGAVGGVVLNSPMGGLNAEAVTVAAALGARIVWLPTISSAAHQRAAGEPELAVHNAIRMRRVDVVRDDVLTPELHEVLEVVAEQDLVLASGHIPMPELLTVFQAARARGASRFLINHPLFPFMGWTTQLGREFRELGAYVEVGCVADRDIPATLRLWKDYDPALMVFGSDLGHVEFPEYTEGLGGWVSGLGAAVPESELHRILVTNGSGLLG